MTKRFALALCITTLWGGTQSVSAGAAPVLEQGRSGRDIVAKKRVLVPSTRVRRPALSVRRASIRRASYRRTVRSIMSRRRVSISRASYRRAARSIVSRRSVSTRRISIASRRRNIPIVAVAPVVSPIQAVSVTYVAPKPVVVAAPQIQPREIPEVVRAVPSMPPVIISLPDPLYDDVEGVSPVASSSLSNTLLAWEGLTALLSGKEPLSQSCYKTEVNTDDPRLIDINDQVNRLTNIPQENGGEPLLSYGNIFHTMSSDDFEKELSQHKQSVKKAAELSLALQDYEKSVANDPNRLEQIKQVGQFLLDRAQCLVDLGARFEHLSHKRSEAAQLSSSQPYSSALATSQIEEREVSLPRSTSSPSLEDLKESLNDLIQKGK